MALTKKLTAAFQALSAAIAASPDGFVYAPAAEVAPFVAEGLVETNDSIKDAAGNIAVRLKINQPTEGVSDMTTETAATPVASSFAVEDNVPLPAVSGPWPWPWWQYLPVRLAGGRSVLFRAEHHGTAEGCQVVGIDRFQCERALRCRCGRSVQDEPQG